MAPHDTCRGCGAPIAWIKTKDGKLMPCNPEEIEIDVGGAKTTIIITDDGKLEYGSPVDKYDLFPPDMTAKGRVSHFATCPKAERFRKR